MRRLFFPLATIVLLGVSSVGMPAHSQSSSEKTPEQRKAQAFFYEAEKALGNGEYADALEFATKSQNLINADNALLASIRVRALAGLGQYVNAQNVLEIYYSLNPTESVERLMSSTIVDIDRNIAAEQQREIDRVVREELLAIERAEKEEREAIFRAEEEQRLAQEKAEAERLAKIEAAKQAELRAIEEAKLEADKTRWEARFDRTTYGDPVANYDDFEIIPPKTLPEENLRNFKKLSKKCRKEYRANKGKDRDASPCTRNPPIYSLSFLQGEFSGYCKVSFDIDAKGHTENIKIIYCTNDALVESTLAAVNTFYYMPANVDGMIVSRRNVATTIRYNLQDEEGNELPLPERQKSKLESFIIELMEKKWPK